jgi:hypothetical protein
MGLAILIFKNLKINVLISIITSILVYFGVLFLLKEQIFRETKNIL